MEILTTGVIMLAGCGFGWLVGTRVARALGRMWP